MDMFHQLTAMDAWGYCYRVEIMLNCPLKSEIAIIEKMYSECLLKFSYFRPQDRTGGKT